MLVAYIIKKTGKSAKKIVRVFLSDLPEELDGNTRSAALTVGLYTITILKAGRTAGATFPDGKGNISGITYHFVGYIDGKDVVTNSTTAVKFHSISRQRCTKAQIYSTDNL